MTGPNQPWAPAPTSRRSDIPVAEGDLDADLARLVHRTSVVRQGFYVVVLLVALAGQVSGAVEALGIPLAAAIPAVGALELGGIVVLANADVRRRLGERAIASRLLSVAIAAGAVTFNWLAHADHLLGGFFAGMSALGYLVWLMHTENQRRDRLRIKGDLPPTTPAYEFAGHWLRHPWLTTRARALAKADPRLGLYDSLATARADVRRERRQAAIAKVLHRKIRSAVDPRTADIAIAVYDLDEIAARLADQADYDGLTSLIAADLAPERLAPDGALTERTPTGGRSLNRRGRTAGPDAPISVTDVASDVAELTSGTGPRPALPRQAGPTRNGQPPSGATASRELTSNPSRDAAMNGAGAATAGHSGEPGRRRRRIAAATDEVLVDAPTEAGRQSTLFTDLRRDLSHLQPARTQGRLTPAVNDDLAANNDLTPNDALARNDDLARNVDLARNDDLDVDDLTPSGQATERSLRRRVHDALDANVLPGDQRDDTELLNLVFDELRLSDLERLSAQSYVRSWLQEMRSGERIRTP